MDKKIYLILLFCFSIYLLSLNTKIIGEGLDDGIYTLMGKSISNGKLMKTKYPLIYPLILAIGWKINNKFPQNIIILKSFTIIMSILFIYFIFLFFTKFDKKYNIIALLVGISPPIVTLSVNTMSDIPYSLFNMLAILNALFYEEYRNNKYLLLSIIFTIISFFIKTVGWTLILALYLYLLRKYSKKAILSIILLSIILFLINKTTSVSADYFHEFFSKDTTRPWLGNINFIEGIHRGLKNLFLFIPYGASYIIFPFFTSKFLLNLITKIKLNFLLNLLQICIIIFVFIGFLTKKNKFPKLLFYYLIIYGIVLIIWPSLMPPERFLIPISPFLFYFFFSFFEQIGEKLKINIKYIMILIFLSCIIRDSDLFFFRQNNEEWEKKIKVFNWIKENTNENDKIMVGNVAQFELYTNRKFIPLSIPLKIIPDYIITIYSKNWPEIEYLNFYKKYLTIRLVYRVDNIFIYKVVDF